MRALGGVLFLGGVVLSATSSCGPPSVPEAATIVVTTEPESPLDAVPPVVRLRAAGLGSVAPALVLFVGELGSYYLGKVHAGEIPGTLLEREVPALAFASEDGKDGVLAPSLSLARGGKYTLAILGGPRLATFTVSSDTVNVAARLWPPASGAWGDVRAVYCAPDAVGRLPDSVALLPGGVVAHSLPGADSTGALESRCLRLEAGPVGTSVVPPPFVGGVALDPSPLVPIVPVDVPAVTCDSSETVLGPGCLRIEDDRAVLRGPSAPALWALSVNGGEPRLDATDAKHRVVFSGLEPSAAVRVTGTVTELGGHETAVSITAATLAPQLHVVLSEVLANSIGPEPAQEWVEIQNDAAVPASIGGLLLTDGGGETVLPAATLSPGERALVVGDDFDRAAPGDVPPAPGTLLLRVPRVGTAGLSNAGETLTLAAPDGTVLSRFPALPAPKAGVSIARRDASAPVDEPSAFGVSAAPGASPGWENHIVTP